MQTAGFLHPVQLEDATISNALGGKSKKREPKGGRGGQPGAARQKRSIDNLARKFCPKGSPTQFLVKKKGRPMSRRGATLSHELASNNR
jgi:hypothetical protein